MSPVNEAAISLSTRTVSVIIPACNCVGSLAEAVDSALSQELAPTEVIVVNDGSTDATHEVARSYGDRIVYMEQDNLGQGAARNAALSIARGEFIAFLDADDFWQPTFLRTCVDLLLLHPELIAVSTGLITRMLDGSERVHPQPFSADVSRWGGLLRLDNFFAFWARYDHVRTGSSVIRHSIIKNAGLQRADLRVSQDLEYWGYLATFGTWGFTPQPLWVGNSRQAACRQGWLAKYEKRRRLCPDIEQWGSRIEPRLRPCERDGYAQVKGRVAMIYAQNKILAGARDSAYEVVRKYGQTMPRCRMSRIMRSAVPLGRLGWFLACHAICLKERAKAVRLQLG